MFEISRSLEICGLRSVSVLLIMELPLVFDGGAAEAVDAEPEDEYSYSGSASDTKPSRARSSKTGGKRNQSGKRSSAGKRKSARVDKDKDKSRRARSKNRKTLKFRNWGCTPALALLSGRRSRVLLQGMACVPHFAHGTP